MNRASAVLAGTALLVSVIAAEAQGTNAQTRQVTVNGEAEVQVVPDLVVLTLGIETSNMDLMAARADRPVPATEARSTVSGSGQLARAAANSNRVKDIYEVKRGDTLASVAALFKTSVASLKSWNPRIAGNNRLTAGQHLTVYRLAN